MRNPVGIFLLSLAVSAPAMAVEVVPVPQFQAIELRGGGELQLRQGPVQRVTLLDGSRQFTNVSVEREGKLRIDACNARCPQRYRLRILVESPRIPRTLAVSGGGTITASSGTPERELTLAVSGGGLIDTRAVAAEVVTAAVNGGGEVRYWGNPVVTSAIQGGGNVRPGS